MWFKLVGETTFTSSAVDDLAGGFFGISSSDVDAYVIVSGLGSDTVNAGSGHDRVIDSWLAPDLDMTDLTAVPIPGGGNDVFYGGLGNDTLEGKDGDDHLSGDDEDDRLLGGEGNDLMFGGTGNDALIGGLGDDTMMGGEGADWYGVNSLGDVIDDTGVAGRDMVFSKILSLNLSLYTGVEDGRLFGRTDLSLTGNALDNVLNGSAGANTIDGMSGDDFLAGLGGSDTLLGGEGNDRLLGGGKGDALEGGAGDDTLNGNSGVDTLTGDTGADDFLFFTSDRLRGGQRADVITDFASGEDQIIIAGDETSFELVDRFSATGGTEFRFVSALNRLRCDYDGDGDTDFAFVLEGVTTISASDIIIYGT